MSDFVSDFQGQNIHPQYLLKCFGRNLKQPVSFLSIGINQLY